MSKTKLMVASIGNTKKKTRLILMRFSFRNKTGSVANVESKTFILIKCVNNVKTISFDHSSDSEF